MTRRLLTLAAVLLACTGAGWAQLNDKGKAAYSRGDYIEAERLFRQAIALAPDEAELHYHRGVALTHLYRWAEAVAAYEKALALRPPATLAASAQHALRSVAPMVRPTAPAAASEPDTASPARRRPRRVELSSDSVRVRRQHGNWMVDVTLNDMQQARFLVDTGAFACAITPELAEAIGIVPDPDMPPVTVRGVGGNIRGRLVKIPTIRVGETEAQDVTAVVLPLPDGLQGILGNTFLSRYAATLDPTESVLTLRAR